MAPRRHLTRQDMKQDEFVSWFQNAADWAEDHARAVIIGLIALAVAGALVAGGFAWWRSHQEAAFSMLAKVQKIAETPLADAQDATPESAATAQDRASKVVSAADDMLKIYPGGVAGAWAKYLKAQAELDLGHADEASTEALAVADDQGTDTLLGSLATVLAGRAEQKRGNLKRAVELFDKAAGSTDPGFPAEVALLDKARCLAAMGDNQAAMSTYRKILDVYSKSPLAEKANQGLQELQNPTGGGA